MKRPGSFAFTILTVIVVAAASVFLAFLLKDGSAVGEKEASSMEEQEAAWTGMDEKVVEAFASEHGREPAEPLLPLEEGDLLLFLFCLGGFVAGCVVGYTWRMSVSEGAKGTGVEGT